MTDINVRGKHTLVQGESIVNVVDVKKQMNQNLGSKKLHFFVGSVVWRENARKSIG